MSVEFQEEEFARPTQRPERHSGMQRLLIRMGVAHNATQASVMLIALAILLFGVSAGVIYTTQKEPEIELAPDIDPETNLPYGVPAAQ